MVAGNTLLKFFFGQMLDQLREDGAARVHPSLFHPEDRRKEVNPPFSIQIVPASTIRYHAYLQWVRMASRNFSRTAVPRCDGEDKPLDISALRRDVRRIVDEEQRTITQVCEMLLHEGVEAYKKEGPKFIQRLVAKQRARVKDS